MVSILKPYQISKEYNKHKVLKSVSLEINPGEIHGLLGENGAGKSTLLNILFGRAIIRETGGYLGDIYFNGQKISIKNSQDAINLGIGMVHQEFALIPDMNVAENISMGNEATFALSKRLMGEHLALIDKQANHTHAHNVLDRLGVNINTRLKVLDLSVNFKQFVELAREIGKSNLQLLILDEPTAALGQEDAARLLDILLDLSSRGVAILLVSHRLEEVMSISQRITVLRDGEVSGRFERDDFDIKQISICMVGRYIEQLQSPPRTLPETVIMQYRDFAVDMPGESIENINLDIYAGEILGIAGLAGHGKLALGNGTLGIHPSSGSLSMDGDDIDTFDTAAVMEKGIFLLPEERRGNGLLLDHSVMDNIIFSAVQQRNKFLKPFILPALRLIDKKKSAAYAQDCISRLDIRCRNLQQNVRLLSGGNQQKVCLARAIAMEPRVLFVAEPTRGIDIGAKEIILEELRNINQLMGTTIIIASSELEELQRICDRIVILYEGRIFTILNADCDNVELALALSGKRLTELC